MVYNDFVGDMVKLMDIRARNAVNLKQKTRLVKVDSTDGFVADVLELDKEGNVIEGRSAISNVTILQSKYFSPCLQKDDIGILLNIGCYIGNILYGIIESETLDDDYYVFIPIVKKDDFKSKSSEFMIQSLDEKSKIVVDNLNINETTTNKSLVCEKNISETAKENITITSEKALSLKGKDSVTIASDSKIEINSTADMSISSNSPLEIKGGGQSLATALDTFCTALGSLASAGFEAAAIASIVAASNALKAQLKGILK